MSWLKPRLTKRLPTASEHFAYASLVVTARRAASEIIKRDTPLKKMLMPTSVPMAHSVLDGQVAQSIPPRTIVITPLSRNQDAPFVVRCWK